MSVWGRGLVVATLLVVVLSAAEGACVRDEASWDIASHTLRRLRGEYSVLSVTLY